MMQREYDNKAAKPDNGKGVWVSIVEHGKVPYIVWVAALVHEHIEHRCMVTTGRHGTLIRSGPEWRYEVEQ